MAKPSRHETIIRRRLSAVQSEIDSLEANLNASIREKELLSGLLAEAKNPQRSDENAGEVSA